MVSILLFIEKSKQEQLLFILEDCCTAVFFSKSDLSRFFFEVLSNITCHLSTCRTEREKVLDQFSQGENNFNCEKMANF
jgi:hypothetical protein